MAVRGAEPEVLQQAAAALFLARAVGSRGAGQTVTGNDQTAEGRLDTLRATAEARPGEGATFFFTLGDAEAAPLNIPH